MAHSVEKRTLTLRRGHQTGGLLHAHAGDGARQPGGEHFGWEGGWMDEVGDGVWERMDLELK